MNASKTYEVQVFLLHTNFTTVRNFKENNNEKKLYIAILCLGWSDRVEEIRGVLMHINI